MRSFLSNVYLRMRALRGNEAQDLIEYALVVAVIALAAVAGMSTVATDVNQAFSSIGTLLTQYT